MRFNHPVLILSILSPISIYAGHIPMRRQEAPGSEPPMSALPAPAPAPPRFPPVPASPSSDSSNKPSLPGPLNAASGTLPLPDAANNISKGVPGPAPPPPIKSKQGRGIQHRRQFHNADFASSGSLPSSNIESAATSENEVHKRRFTRALRSGNLGARTYYMYI